MKQQSLVILVGMCLGLLLLPPPEVRAASASPLSDVAEAMVKQAQKDAADVQQLCQVGTDVNAKAGATLQRAVQDAVNRNRGAAHGGNLVPEVAKVVQSFLVTTEKNAGDALDTVTAVTQQIESVIGRDAAQLMAVVKGVIQSGKMTAAEAEAWGREQATLRNGIIDHAIEACKAFAKEAKRSLDANTLQIQKALISINPDKLESLLINYVRDGVDKVKDQMDFKVNDLDKWIHMYAYLTEAATIY